MLQGSVETFRRRKRLIRKDGDVVWVQAASSALRDTAGRPERILVVEQDVIPERDAASALDEERRSLISILDAIPAFVYIQARDHTIPFAAGRFREYFGDPEGRTCHQIFRDCDTPCAPCQTLDLLESQEELVREWTDRKGRVFELRERPYRTSDGEEAVLIIGTEITDLVQATHALRESESRFRQLAESLPEIVFECSLEGRITYANQVAFTRHGFSQGELIGASVFDVLAPTDRSRAHERIASLLAGGADSSAQYEILRPDGSTFPAIIHSSVIRSDGRPAGLRGIIVDITEQMEAQKAMETADQIVSAIPSAILIYGFREPNELVLLSGNPASKSCVDVASHIGSPFASHWDASMVKQLQPRLLSILSDGREYEREVVLHPQGEMRAFHLRAFRIPGRRVVLSFEDITERKRIEQELLLKNEVFEAGLTANCATDADGTLAHVNAAFLRLWRFPSDDEVLGRSIAVCFDDPDESALVLETLRIEGMWHGSFVAKRADRTTFICEGMATAIRDENGQIVAHQFANIDITDRVVQREALEESEARHRMLFENASVEIGYFTVDGDLIAVNRTAARRMGGEPEDFIGQNTKDHSARPEEALRRITLASRSQDSRTYEDMVGDENERRYILRSYTALRDAQGHVTGVQVIASDITDRKKVEIALRESEAQYRSLFENAALGIYRTTPDGRILAANTALLRMLGFDSFEELAARNLNDEGYSSETPRSHFKKLVETTGSVTGLESAWKRRDGSTIYVREYATAVRDESGSIICYEGTLEDVTERKVAERRLQESVATQQGILRASPVGIGLLRNGELQWISERVCSMTGYRAGELIGRPFSILMLGSEDLDLIAEATAPEAGEDVVRLGTRWERKDGNTLDVDLAFSRLDAAAPDRGSIFTVQDTSEQKRMEESLRLTQFSMDSTQAIILWLRADGQIVFVNEAACGMLGYSRDELLERFAWDIQLDYPTGDRARLWDELRVSEPTTSETVFTRSDGSRFPVELNARYLSFHNREYEFVIAIDITERKAAERALVESEENYRTIFNAANDVILLHDAASGRVLDANEKTVEMFGYSVPEFVKLRVEEFSSGIPPYTDEEALRLIHAAARGRPQIFEWRLRKKNGDLFWGEVNLREVTLLGESVVLSIVRDISDRKELEARLRQSQKLESIGTLASGVAHEINNPLTGMINYAELIRTRVNDDSLREFAEGIKTEGDRVARIVRNLLSFSRQDPEQHSPARMRDIVDASLSIVGSLLRKDLIRIDIDIPETLPTVQCRSQQIQQVMINLISNARDGLNARSPDEDGEKVLRISSRVVQSSSQSWVRTTVEDTGVGIPEQIIERIFDPFFTTKARDEGTGLGLSISYGIVRDHGGRLTVDSVPDQRTRFHVDLPLSDSE